MVIKHCKFCEKDLEFENGYQFGGHVSACLMNPGRKDWLDKLKEIGKLRSTKQEFKLNCVKCDKEYSIITSPSNIRRNKYKRCCSYKCANTRTFSKEQRESLSISMKNSSLVKADQERRSKESPKYILICPYCSKEVVLNQCQVNVRKTCGSKECKSKQLSKSLTGKTGGARPNAFSNGKWYFCKEMDKLVYLDSTWEIEYAEFLDSKNIKWIRPNYFDWIDSTNKRRKYYPDFYLIDTNEYIDIKNDYLISLPETQEKINTVRSMHDINLQIVDRKALNNILRV